MHMEVNEMQEDLCIPWERLVEEPEWLAVSSTSCITEKQEKTSSFWEIFDWFWIT